MLGKLIKHDFRSLSRVLLPTQIAILGATIIATAGFAFNLRSGYHSFEETFAVQTLQLITGFLSVLMLIAIFASCFLVAFIIFQRFYKSFMCDEGYLTFTLPVTTNELLWSKLITAMLWCIINGAVIFVCMLIFMAFGTSNTSFFNAEIFVDIGRGISEVCTVMGGRLVLPTIEFILACIVGLAYSILEIYLALVIGGLLTQKHKILAAIGAYFGINIIVGIFTSIAQTVMSNNLIKNGNFNMNFGAVDGVQAFDMFFSVFNPVLLFMVALSAVMAVAFFLVSHYLLKNKLNLE